jgi:predicted dehydrogenase
MIGIGIIGFGKMGQTRARAIASSDLGRVVCVHDPYVTDFGQCLPVASAEQVIGHPEVEAVVICTPNCRNRPLTIAALSAGKHVFCEKPPAFCAAEVEEIIAVEKRSGCKLMYGFNHRHHQSVREMKALVDSGRFGRVLWMRGRYGKSVDHNYFSTWRARKELAGGGILLDQGIHMLDLFLLLAGDFDEVQALVSSLYWKLADIEDNVFAVLRSTRSGTVASLHSTMTQWRHLFSLEVFLERGYMTLNGLKTQSGTYGDEVLSVAKNRSTVPAATWDDEERTTYHVDRSWEDEISCFLNAIQANQPITTGNSTDALQVMRLVDLIYRNRRHESAILHDKLHSL